MTIEFDCLPNVIAAQQEGIPKGNWNNAAKQFYAEKTFGILKGIDEIRIRMRCSSFANNQNYFSGNQYFNSKYSWPNKINNILNLIKLI